MFRTRIKQIGAPTLGISCSALQVAGHIATGTLGRSLHEIKFDLCDCGSIICAPRASCTIQQVADITPILRANAVHLPELSWLSQSLCQLRPWPALWTTHKRQSSDPLSFSGLQGMPFLGAAWDCCVREQVFTFPARSSNTPLRSGVACCACLAAPLAAPA